MIIGDKREAVIENISRATRSGELNCKVEVGDPVVTKEQGAEILNRYLRNRHKASYRVKSAVARRMANSATKRLNADTEIVGLEKIENLTGGAIITSNHFSPIDNTFIRYLTTKLGKKRINIISQQSNFAMTGMLGFLMNYADTIPLSNDYRYVYRHLLEIMRELLDNGEYILIYPEQEMWFHYRKPRPLMRGAYNFATKLNVPVISCFIEMQDMDEMDTEEFRKVRYTIHVLDVLFPDPEKNAHENGVNMCQRDYELKKAAYEKIYGKCLDYQFTPLDIAGWTGYKGEAVK